MKRVVGPKGQVVIPRDIRKDMGLREGSEVIFEVTGGTVIIRPAKDPDKAVDDFVHAVRRKLKREINLDVLLEEELKRRFDLR